MKGTLTYANFALLVLFPVSWFAPLMRAGLLPLFGLSEISVVSGFVALWSEDVFLALVVAVFGFVAPYAKTLALALVHLGRAGPRVLGAVNILGRLAMADIFLIALYIVIAKGVGVGRVEVAWGTYLFTACVLASLVIAHLTKRDTERH
ncbi:MAG: paraquat-inducible protein A [Pseudomonadota bacterium]